MNPEVLFQDLVSIPSLSGEEGEIANFLETVLLNEGLDFQRIGDNLLVQIDRGPGPDIFFTSHLDTVPPATNWQGDPWQAQWQDHRLCGLGTNDAKGCVVAMLAAAHQFRSLAWQGKLTVALVVEEETSNAGIAEVLKATSLPDMAVVGEPTDLEVVRAQAGLAILVAEWQGQSCHAAHVAKVPHVHALHRAATEISALPEHVFFTEDHPLLGATSLVPTVFKSGDRHNRIPDVAEAVYDVRLVPPDRAESVAAWLQTQLPKAAVRIRSSRLKPVETPADHPLVLEALAAAGKAEAIGSTTLSDMALLHQVPVVKCGPGNTSRSHTPNEYLDRHELQQGIAFYRQLLQRLANLVPASCTTSSQLSA
ncbi:MAG: M20/M25/M40 family metallo-hydrolase [Planctomycetota bacterium]|nr:MAG: M20/M25/M40 family metallo-hydrolase [Planctomycetota bacterium]